MRENSQLEFKENMQSATYLKTVSAFANFNGGTILFGVRDDGTMCGIENPEKACLSLENQLNDSVKPVPIYTLEIREGNVVALVVETSPDKPYRYRGKAYKHYDTSTVEVSRLEENRLILEGVHRSFETLPSARQDLSFTILEVHLQSELGIAHLTEDILKTLELYTEKEGYNNAGALLADENTFPGVDIVRFGANLDEIMERQTFEHVSLLAQLENSMQMFRRYYQYERIEGATRAVVDRIPERAFREALANALVHRQWDVGAQVRVSMFADRIEIYSPGGLPDGMSEEGYLYGQLSILRNPIIGNVFFRLRYIEKFGTGIRRINEAYSGAIDRPHFAVYAESLTVVLPVLRDEAVLSDEETQLLALLEAQGAMSRADIETAMGINKAKAIRLVNHLLEAHLIERHGNGRSVVYRKTIGLI